MAEGREKVTAVAIIGLQQEIIQQHEALAGVIK